MPTFFEAVFEAADDTPASCQSREDDCETPLPAWFEATSTMPLEALRADAVIVPSSGTCAPAPHRSVSLVVCWALACERLADDMRESAPAADICESVASGRLKVHETSMVFAVALPACADAACASPTVHSRLAIDDADLRERAFSAALAIAAAVVCAAACPEAIFLSAESAAVGAGPVVGSPVTPALASFAIDQVLPPGCAVFAVPAALSA